MEESIGSNIFFMITLGLIIGFISHYVFGRRGVGLVPSIIIGLLGALVTGLSVLILGFAMPLTYSIIGAMGFLFLVNTFRQDDRAIFIDTDSSDEGGP